ncbi:MULTISPECIES: aldehyde dehydrogenase family protein [unclassified Mycolicibacterium]|uniref:aldehyde dehydrogenase family protein n=1 Tax=unclassified Mycolicibacterium TaxID=2636767 RepID=UPI0012DE49ED|nr:MULTISPECIES: aldehyde dehydrogenase family protein [unclassified Mycolicibacterium]MUL85651.1 aldehyde dehydrogenase family protein [Mycolicibacterium sp. CBMA 329]MUL91528.1 aldehyde dehydrogenase family protein [Mycolicibacterium sp. CBMA 331]MUM02232.1 aldehyde dehydrogenase family protein [Mycolicibacterium sp. CBMA 334]MUM27309.1 aldehyde dehydrogenase family protein [Mycolicibacterium sp. CBMA 295]MUM41182.1 aldehyde dehydrogenase family protein [Mycolicibacterium sp. CBMA 247]
MLEASALPTTTTEPPQACFIGNAWVDGESDHVIAVEDPATEELIAGFNAASVTQTDDALRVAREAFDRGIWSRRTPLERSNALHQLADRFERDAARFADMLVAEIGSPTQLVRGVQVDCAIELLRWFADAAARGPRQGFEEVLPVHRRPVASRSVLLSEPAGVVAGITAYNFPLLLLIRKIGGALAAGCTTVVMPSPRAPLSTIEFMRLLAETDIPPGAVNLVVGGPEVGMRLTTSPMVDMITFTGSRAVGQAVMVQAAAGIKKVVLELGGKSANIVLPGANVEGAVRPSLLRFSLNAGQACGATTRTFVPRADYERYVEESQRTLAELVVGDPRDPATVVGPLIRGDHRASVQGYIDRAIDAGATVEASAAVAEQRGHYVAPQLIGNVSNHSEISREELFGPVGVIMPFDSVDEAIAMANDSRFGLNANIWGPHSEAIEVARHLRTGNVTINGGGGGRQDVPWGGYGESGIGKEAGEAGYLEFFEFKHVQWPV